jgi:hypothetical protein
MSERERTTRRRLSIRVAYAPEQHIVVAAQDRVCGLYQIKSICL